MAIIALTGALGLPTAVVAKEKSNGKPVTVNIKKSSKNKTKEANRKQSSAKVTKQPKVDREQSSEKKSQKNNKLSKSEKQHESSHAKAHEKTHEKLGTKDKKHAEKVATASKHTKQPEATRHTSRDTKNDSKKLATFDKKHKAPQREGVAVALGKSLFRPLLFCLLQQLDTRILKSRKPGNALNTLGEVGDTAPGAPRVVMVFSIDWSSANAPARSGSRSVWSATCAPAFARSSPSVLSAPRTSAEVTATG